MPDTFMQTAHVVIQSSLAPGRAIRCRQMRIDVPSWLARHSRWTFHFTPTSASWLNAVEGFFAKLTRRRLK